MAGGGGLFPPDVVHGPPHDAGGLLVGSETLLVNPLNADGASPPVSTFTFDQTDAQNVFVPGEDALVSPSAKAPPVGNANTIAVAAADDGL